MLELTGEELGASWFLDHLTRGIQTFSSQLLGSRRKNSVIPLAFWDGLMAVWRMHSCGLEGVLPPGCGPGAGASLGISPQPQGPLVAAPSFFF